MSVRRPPDPKTIVAAVLLSLACAWGAFSGLSRLAQPAGLGARLHSVDAAVAKAESAPREGGDPSFYVKDAICRDPPSRAADLLKTRLATQAAAAGLQAPKITIADPGSADVSQALTPVMFELEATGRYDMVLAYLKLLSRDGPEIFADAVDLKSEVSAVSLKLSGRVMCLTSAV